LIVKNGTIAIHFGGSPERFCRLEADKKPIVSKAVSVFAGREKVAKENIKTTAEGTSGKRVLDVR